MFMIKRIIAIVITLFLLFSVTTSAKEAYPNYGFDYWWSTPNLEPEAYIPQKVITAKDIGVESLNGPEDIFVSNNEEIYIADTGNQRILITDKNFRVQHEIKEFTINGVSSTFLKPSGIYVTSENILYVADTGNSRIVVFDSNNNYLKQYLAPQSKLIDSTFVYSPIKIAVDKTAKMFVVSENETKGALQLDKDGKIISFYGAVKTIPNAAEAIWRMIATKEQLAAMSLNVPTNISNLDIDENGFLFSTVATIDTKQTIDDTIFVRKLNPMGNDVLKRNYNTPIIGDWISRDESGKKTTSLLCDVNYIGNGIFSVLGQENSRVYTYDNNGNLIFVFGSKGEQYGQVKNATALDHFNDGRYIVLDSGLNQIVVYSPTDYANMILDATIAFTNTEYEKSEQIWMNVLKYTTKSDIAFDGIGRSLLRNGKYQEAMSYFKLANNRPMYSASFKYYRNDLSKKAFPYVILGIVLALVGLFIYKRKIKPERKAKMHGPIVSNLKYAKRVIFHPFDSFWVLKRERTHTFPAAMIILGIGAISTVSRVQLTGFTFNYYNISNVNILVEILKVVFPFFVWCIANWSITTLVDGEGSLQDIAVTTSYALIPFFISNFIYILLSNYVILSEAGFISLIDSIALVWTIGLLFIGIMTIHQFSIPKTLVTVVAAFIGMIIILLIILLLFSLIQQLLGFSSIVYREIFERR